MVIASALIGRKVLTSDAYLLGQVCGVEIDVESWIVTYMKIMLSKRAVKDLRLEPPLFMDVVFSLPVKLIKEIGEKISLNIPFSTSLAELSSANTSQPLSVFDLSDIEAV